MSPCAATGCADCAGVVKAWNDPSRGNAQTPAVNTAGCAAAAAQTQSSRPAENSQRDYRKDKNRVNGRTIKSGANPSESGRPLQEQMICLSAPNDLSYLH